MNQMTTFLKTLLKWILSLLAIFLLYVIGVLAFSSYADYQPDEVLALEIEGNTNENISVSDTFTAISWNIGYGGLGEESMMFYDLGRSLMSGPYTVIDPKDIIVKNTRGIQDFVRSNDVDFFLFQEVDQQAKRSHYINQYDSIASVLPNYKRTFARNFWVDYIPIPILEPWNTLGSVEAGLATFSRFTPKGATRYQLPGSYDWPTRIFHLDRCIAVQHYPLDSAKTFTLVHLHNSAYDGGLLKKQQLKYLDSLITRFYDEGHYVLVGGDWNQTPTDVDLDKLYAGGIPGRSWVSLGENFMPEEWTWAFDPRYTTSRRVNAPYVSGKSDEKLIDYFLVSPNIEIIEVNTLKQQFKVSDHEPVQLKFVLQ